MLTPQQEELIPVYHQKWRNIILSTQPINQEKARQTLKTVYNIMDKSSPKIEFYNGHKTAMSAFLSQDSQQLVDKLGAPCWKIPLSSPLLEEVYQQLDPELCLYLQEKLNLTEQLQPILQSISLSTQQLSAELSDSQQQKLRQIWAKLSYAHWEQLWEDQDKFIRQQLLQFPGGNFLVQLSDSFRQWSQPILEEFSKQPLIQEWQEIIKEFSLPWIEIINGIEFMYIFLTSLEAYNIAFLDYCISVLNCHYDAARWKALQSLVADCNQVLLFEKTCLVFERPIKLSLDNQTRLHAEGEAAIKFADGVILYAYNGVNLPEKYGRVHPHQWRSQWILQEDNAELRRVLIQGIGYARICQELEAIELDSWREYTLLIINQDVDVEPIYLLKMTCPSTGFIHALRVPPHIESAREAIRWVNWGIDPEDFSVAT